VLYKTCSHFFCCLNWRSWITLCRFGGGSRPDISVMSSAGIPQEVSAFIQSSILRTFFFFFSHFFSIGFYFLLVVSHLSNSISIMLLNDLYSLNSPYIPAKSTLCALKISNNPSTPRTSNHLFYLKTTNTLLKIFLILLPPPTFEGRAPSEIIKRRVRVWSRIRYMSFIGAIAFFTVFTSSLISLAIFYQVDSISSFSSTFSKHV